MIYKIAELLRDQISGLNFVEIAAGLAKPHTVRVNNTPPDAEAPEMVDKIVPMAYNDLGLVCEEGDLYALVPNTKKMSIVWWEDNGIELVSEDTYYYHSRASLTLVAWWNLPLINTFLRDPSSLVANLIAAIPERLTNVDYLSQIRVAFEGEQISGNELLSKYTFDDPENQYSTFPYAVTAINFSVDFAFGKNCTDPVVIAPSVCPPKMNPGDYSEEYQAVYAAFNTKPTTAEDVIFNTMVAALVAAGSWAKCDFFDFFSAHNRVDSLINWVSPGTFDPSQVQTPLWTKYEGFTCVQTPRGYIRCNYNPNDDAVLYALDSATAIIGVGSSVTDLSEFGSNDVASTETRINGNSGGDVKVSINSGFQDTVASALSGVGHFGGTRANATQVKIWQNVTFDLVSENSVSLPDREFYTTTSNPGATPEYMQKQIRYALVASLLTEAEYIATINAIEAALVSLGTGII